MFNCKWYIYGKPEKKVIQLHDSPHEETGQLPSNSALLMIDTELNSRIRSLNIKKREIYEVINNRVRGYKIIDHVFYLLTHHLYICLLPGVEDVESLI